MRGHGADKAIPGAGGVDRPDVVAWQDQRLAVQQRNDAAFAQRHADDPVRAGAQRPRSVKKLLVVVGIAKLAFGQQTELGFIEDQKIGEIEQSAAEFDGRRRIEDGGRAGGAGLLEEGRDRGQGNFELADRDIARRERSAGHVGGTQRAHWRRE